MATPQLDHIVILLPYKDIVTPPKWITDHFTVAPGGRHGDNKTENKLIVFTDGSYIELIAFIDDNQTHREGHWWGDKGYGIIDYAFTLKEGSEAFAKVQQNIHKLDIPEAWKPQDLRAGSRIKPDGETIEWKVAFPQGSARGRAPFWCFDVTPRERRVTTDEKFTKHPSGVKGVGNIMTFLEAGSIDITNVQKMLDVILPQSESDRLDDTTWDLNTVRKLTSSIGCQLCIVEATQDYEKTALKNGRQLVARLSLLSDDSVGGGDIRRIRQEIEGDQLLIGFVSA